ncbi:unnamed protein product [Symbiodinium sp. CCMP2592]|nr:unnamed protein product [Symbiodinium sp. CCMP2592]
MADRAVGPPPGFEDVGSTEPPVAMPPTPTFGGSEKPESDKDPKSGEGSGDPSHTFSDRDVKGADDGRHEGSATQREWPSGKDTTPPGNGGPVSHGDHGATAPRADGSDPWQDGRDPWHKGSQDAQWNSGWSATTAPTVSDDGWGRRSQRGGRDWGRWGGGHRDDHRGYDQGGYHDGPRADGRDRWHRGPDTGGHRQGTPWADGRDHHHRGYDSGPHQPVLWTDGWDPNARLREHGDLTRWNESGALHRWNDGHPPSSDPGWSDSRAYDDGSQTGWSGWHGYGEQVAGPRPTEKVTVPTFTAEDTEDLGNSARSYLRQIEVWKRITRLPANQLGLVLYQHLGGKAWIAAEELSVPRLSSGEGLQYFTSWVAARFLDLEVARIGRAFSDFFRKLRRRPGQTIREYNTEYDRLHGRLREVGCSLPEECAAWLYLDRLQLDEPQELNLLASVGNRYSLHHLQHAAVLHDRGQRKPWEAGNARPRRTNFAHMTDHDYDTDGEDPFDGEDGIPEDVAEAFMTCQSAKERYRAQQRGRGTTSGGERGGKPDGPGDERKPGETRDSDREAKLKAMKARSFCGGCGRKGHWHKDDACPLNNKPGAQPKSDGSANVAMTTVLPADVYTLKHIPSKLLGVADTACARTVAGTQWLQSYANLLAEIGQKPTLMKECEAYRFGTGKVHYSSFYVIAAFRLGGYNIQVRTSIITGDIPLLLSKTVLGKLGMIYDVQNGKADFRAIKLYDYLLTTTSSGHPAIPIVPVNLMPGEIQIEDLRLQQAEQYMSVLAVAHQAPQIPKYSGIFYDKKLDPSTRDMLSQDRLQRDTFLVWWEKCNLDRDFWLETQNMWVRVHMVPRRAMFNPSTWRTGSTVLRDMLVSTIGAVRMTECVCCKTGAWIESTVDQWEHGQVDQTTFPLLWIGRTVFYKGMDSAECRAKETPISRMTKAQLLQEAQRVGAVVHPTWTVIELRATIRDHVSTYGEKTAADQMKGLSSLCLADLSKKAAEMGVMVPDRVTKGNLLRLVRSTVSSTGDTIMTIGRWKGSLFRDIPDSYGSWAVAETARSENSSPELVMYARWWQEHQHSKSNKVKIYDEDSEAEDSKWSQRAATSSKGSWDEVSLTPTKGYTGKGNTKATPKRPSKDLIGKDKKIMDSQPDQDVLDEIQALETKLALLKDKARDREVCCCGAVREQDCIAESDYVRGYRNKALGYNTNAVPDNKGGGVCGPLAAEAYDNKHHEHYDYGAPRDGARGLRQLRYGDSSFNWADTSYRTASASSRTPWTTMRLSISSTTLARSASARKLRDFNIGALNHTVTFGQRAGGDLWLEEDIDESMRMPPTVTEKPLSFDPFLRHSTGAWDGDRWCLTYHTVRGIKEVGGEIRKFLRGCGFPLPKAPRESRGPRPKPAKSERKSIMNAAGKLSVLMATFLAAAGTFLNEVQDPVPEYDPIVMMEIGGYEGTIEATELNKAVIEPILWPDYEKPDVQENAYHFVKRSQS